MAKGTFDQPWLSDEAALSLANTVKLLLIVFVLTVMYDFYQGICRGRGSSGQSAHL